MNPAQAPDSSKYQVFAPTFDRARQLIETGFAAVDIDLSAAMPQTDGLYLNIAGDFLYIDAASTGIATLDLNVQQSATVAPFLVQAGFAIQAIFIGVKFRWTQQPGLTLRVMYATGQRVVPASGAQVVSSWTAPQTAKVQEQGPTGYGAVYGSVAALTSFQSDTIFLAAANVNGAIIWSADWLSISATAGGALALMAYGGGLPATFASGQPLAITSAYSLSGANFVSILALRRPIRIPATRGLFFLRENGESYCLRSCVYTLL